MSRFIDTNILLYSISQAPNEQEKRTIARAILDGTDCVLSAQVLNEFFVRATRQGNPDRISRDDAWTNVKAWQRFRIVVVDAGLLDAGWQISQRTNYGWWDCLVIAAAQVSGCTTLLTEDMQHGHVVDGVRIENPFRDLV